MRKSDHGPSLLLQVVSYSESAYWLMDLGMVWNSHDKLVLDHASEFVFPLLLTIDPVCGNLVHAAHAAASILPEAIGLVT